MLVIVTLMNCATLEDVIRGREIGAEADRLVIGGVVPKEEKRGEAGLAGILYN